MTPSGCAIVIGLDSAIGLSVIRDLGLHGVAVHGVAGHAAAIGAVSRHCTGWSLRPEGSVRHWLPELIDRTGARAVFAISETDLIDLTLLPPVIGACHILTPRGDALRRVLDKRRTLAAAAEAGLLAPRTWQPLAGEDFAARIAATAYPLVAKWADPPAIIPLLEQAGMAWIKTEYVHGPDALRALLDRYRPIGRWPMIQQYCRGVGLGQMIHMQGGDATLCFQHRRLHEWPPEGGVSTLCTAEPRHLHRAQMALSRALLAALDWEGPAMVEYRYEAETGRYWLMEVNGRFWGSLPLALHCGAHFAWEGYRRAVLGERTSAPPPRDDLRARYMIPETRRLLRLLFGRGRIGDPFFRARPVREVLAYMLAFLDPRMRYYVFMPSDPRPWLRDLRQVLRKAVRLEKR